MKTLISWLAYNTDFKEVEKMKQVDPEGPTLSFHRDYFRGYDRHLILSQEKSDDIRLEMLLNALKKDFPRHPVQTKYMGIENVIDLAEIKQKVEDLLTSISGDEEIDIFISPGTATMQTAWYLIQMTLGRAGKLWQTFRHKTTGQLERVEAKIEKAPMPVMAILSNKKSEQPLAHSDFLITPSIQKTYEMAHQAANAHGVPVLIKGETGTGKEHLARTIHAQSARKDKDFQALNCGALTESLLESILFGYEKGAFTGATKRMPGLFESTDGGTLFLDEIGELSPKTQAALLRVLQSGEVIRLMASKSIKVDVRILAASHRDLHELCIMGLFRWDLYYRLAVIELELPPLREWTMEDRKQLFFHMAQREALQLKTHLELTIDREAMDVILAYQFPGNIREMENLIRKLLIFADGTVTKASLPTSLTKPRMEASLKLEDVERALIEKVLRLTNWNQSKTQELIGYGSINTLKSKIEKYNIILPGH